MNEHQISVIGAGGWGTALAKLLAEAGHAVTLWARNPQRAQLLREKRVNETYLPGHLLPESLEITSDLRQAAGSRWIILSIPSQHLRSNWERLAPLLSADHMILNTSKGLEAESGLRLSQVLTGNGDVSVGRKLAVLSGPNHAEEVAAGQPTTSVIASLDKEVAEAWQSVLMTPMFRVYTNGDLLGVELGGALKNVIALAAGMADGLGFGDNTKAALITRGLAEMSRLGVAMGADPLTFSGLSGMGDLIATCNSVHSRNNRAGKEIGRGKAISEVIAASSMVIEGIPTCRAALKLARQFGVEMPITTAVAQVLFSGKSPMEAVKDLMGRGPKSEIHALYPQSS